MEYLIRDRLSSLRFLGFDLGQSTPDKNTFRLFRERLTHTGALRVLFDAFDHQLRRSGHLAQPASPLACSREGGQIVDATLVSAPKRDCQ